MMSCLLKNGGSAQAKTHAHLPGNFLPVTTTFQQIRIEDYFQMVPQPPN